MQGNNISCNSDHKGSQMKLPQTTFENLYVFRSKEHMEQQPDSSFTAYLKVICETGKLLTAFELSLL